MGLFKNAGVHCLVDGQFGSTGKGALAAWLAAQDDQPDWAGVISSNGPNSGHTFYHGDEKHVLKQLPTFAVASHLLGRTIPVFLSAGAVINPFILNAEMAKYPDIPVFIHGCAAVLDEEDIAAEHSGTIAAVAGTRSGTGSALARKVQRDPEATWASWSRGSKHAGTYWHTFNTAGEPYFLEVAQGFSLGINSFFYPKVTSRECTVMQGIADARIPPRNVAKTYMSVRTYPIRVGNVDGHDSGGWYEDQTEIQWSDLEVEPERTTVTNRIRRVATFSEGQFIEALHANDPDFVFMNFLNYLDEEEVPYFLDYIKSIAQAVPRRFGIIGGFGPKTEDIRLV